MDSLASNKNFIRKQEQQLIDLELNICLLCKRAFNDSDQIARHRSLSKLHSVRLKKLSQRLFTEEQIDELEKKGREALYRDRAKERRLRYNQPDRTIPLEPLPMPLHKLHHCESHPLSKRKPPPINDVATTPIGPNNKGAALLSKMGWREGSGLGKSNDGMKDILKIEAQVGTSGLGSKSYKVDPSLSYKEAVKQVMYQRYREISDEDEVVPENIDDLL